MMSSNEDHSQSKNNKKHRRQRQHVNRAFENDVLSEDFAISPQHEMKETSKSIASTGKANEYRAEVQAEQYTKVSALKQHISEADMHDFVKDHIKHRRCRRFLLSTKKPNCKCGDVGKEKPKCENRCNCGAVSKCGVKCTECGATCKCKDSIVCVCEEVCQCGRRKSQHHEDVLKSPKVTNRKWSMEKHTETIPANSFGTIHFKGYGSENTRPAPYIRAEYIDSEKSVNGKKLENLWYLMSNIWHVSPPKLIISVTGGATKFKLDNKLKQIFKRGLVNAATSTDAWIVTGGTNAGVMQFVGEAVKEYKVTQGALEKEIVALGIVPWGIVYNKHALIDKERNGHFPAVYEVKDPPRGASLSSIDPNHTHFILMDDGTERTFGNETAFRARFEEHVSKQKIGGSKNESMDVPVVSVVLEGGPGTLKTAMDAAKCNTPVVVVKGSGRAADFIVFGFKLINGKDKTDDEFPPDFDLKCTEKAKKMFKWTEENHKPILTEFVENLKELLKRKEMITVFSMDNDDTTNEIDQAILDALLKARGSDVETQLNLALAWNRCDVARNKILDPENRAEWQDKISGSLGENMLFDALLQDKIDFVQLFIDNGVELRNFLTAERLEKLYKNAIFKMASTSSRLLQNLGARVQLGPRVGLYGRENTFQEHSPDLLGAIGKLISYLFDEQHDKMYKDKQWAKSDAFNPAKELFLWAVLLNRRQLAQFFWRAGKDHIGGALMASALLQQLAKEAEKDVETDLSEDLFQHAELYETHAIGVLSECYNKDKELTHQSLTRILDTWGRTTLYSMAESAEKMQFMGHSACQTKLNKIWRGRLALHTPYWKIALCFFLPFLLGMINFTSDEDEKDTGNRTEKKGLKCKGEHKTKDQQALLEVRCCGGGSASLPWHSAAYLFYSSPIVKFGFHTLMYIVFLGLFSYFVMVELADSNDRDWLSVVEFVLWGWAFTFCLEEIRQVWAKEANSLKHKATWYFTSPWNIFDLTVYIMFVLSIVLRFTLHDGEFVWARMFYCSTLLCYYLRFMQTFFVFKEIGPKVIMIKLMMYDLMFFIAILIVFILAYGVVAQALRFPNSDASYKLFIDVIYLPYWQIYGELFLDELEGDGDVDTKNGTISCQENPDDPACPNENALVLILFAVYMMMTNVLLLNLLIAMFSYTFNRVQESSRIVWQYHRFSLIYEYFDRPSLAPPFIIVNHIFRLFSHADWCGCNPKTNHDFKTKLKRDANERLTAFERVGMENYLHQQHLLEREHMDRRVQTTQDRVEKVIQDLDAMREHMAPKTHKPDMGLVARSLTRMSLGDSFDRSKTPEHVNAKQPTQSQLQDELQSQMQPLRDHLHDELQNQLQPLRIQLQVQQQQLDSALQHLEKLTFILSDLANNRENPVQQEMLRPVIAPVVYSGYTGDYGSSNDPLVTPGAKIQHGSRQRSNSQNDALHSSGSTDYPGSYPAFNPLIRSGSTLGLALPGAVGPHYKYSQGVPQVEIQDVEYPPDPLTTHEVRIKMKQNSNTKC